MYLSSSHGLGSQAAYVQYYKWDITLYVYADSDSHEHTPILESLSIAKRRLATASRELRFRSMRHSLM